MPDDGDNGGQRPGLAEAAPHYHGHRNRLRQRFRDAGADAVSDYELLELVLFRAIPQRDLKPLAKDLIARFGSFAEVIAAPPARLAEVKGLGDAAITELKVVQAAAHRLVRGELKRRPVLSSWSTVLDYCRSAQAFADKEQFRVLFLDKRNQLIADEVQQRRHHRSHPGLSARGGQARARTVSHRDHPRAQPSHSTYFDHARSRYYPLNHLNFLACRSAGRCGILGSVLRGISRPFDPSRRPLLPVWRPHLRADGRAQCQALPMERYAAL